MVSMIKVSDGELLDGYGNDDGLLSDEAFHGDNDHLSAYDETVAINHGLYIANLLQ